MNGERRDQSNLVFRYAMPLEFILDRIIRFDPSLLLIIATVLKISYRYLCHRWKIANRSRTMSILSYLDCQREYANHWAEKLLQCEKSSKRWERLTCYVLRDRAKHCQKLRGILYLFVYFRKTFYRPTIRYFLEISWNSFSRKRFG